MYAAADAAVLLALLDSLVAAAPPRQHPISGRDGAPTSDGFLPSTPGIDKVRSYFLIASAVMMISVINHFAFEGDELIVRDICSFYDKCASISDTLDEFLQAGE